MVSDLESQKMYIVMVGLPAMGKSTIAARIKESLLAEDTPAEIFNNGDLRRRMIKKNTSFADFYAPNNKEGVELREKIAKSNLEFARTFLREEGRVAILDATNVSRQRRKLVQDMLFDHPILFIECVNNDTEILDSSIARKASLPEFHHLSFAEARKSFNQRIDYYKKIQAPFSDERNRILVDSLNNSILNISLTDPLPYFDQIRDIILTSTVSNLYLVRHGETHDNLVNRIGGDSRLTQKGVNQAKSMAEAFQKVLAPYIFCGPKIRTIQTAQIIRKRQGLDCRVIPLTEFSEIYAGECECMTYKEIKDQKPEIYQARLQNKYSYIYPGGEGYVSMKERIDRGIKKALFLSARAEHIIIVGHQAANRMILSHFLYRRDQDVPYIYVPQNRYYHIVSTQIKKLIELKEPGIRLEPTGPWPEGTVS